MPTPEWTTTQAIDLLGELKKQGLPDRLFRLVHPQSHGMQTYETYCCKKKTERFNAGSASLPLCDRMQRIVDGARSAQRNALTDDEWERLVQAALGASTIPS